MRREAERIPMRVFGAIAAAVLLAAAGVRGDGGEKVLAAPAALQRVAVIGASASAGFQLLLPDGTPASLAKVLDRMIVGTHEPPQDLADAFFFASTFPKGTDQFERAQEHDPTLVVAVDFLFWFLHGLFDGEEERLEFLEVGLNLLDGFECPLLLSRIPDMSPAVGKMLFEPQMPEPETLKAGNQRLLEWAAEREHVVLVPMADFVERLQAGAALTVRDQSFTPEQAHDLLQVDRLHPTLPGLTVLAALTMDAAVQADCGVQEDDLRWDCTALAAELEASAQR